MSWRTNSTERTERYDMNQTNRRSSMDRIEYENAHDVSVAYDADTNKTVIRFTQGDGAMVHSFSTVGMVEHGLTRKEPA